jgi:hypothetical protein
LGVYYNADITVKPGFLVNIWDVAHWDTKTRDYYTYSKCTISGPLVNLGIWLDMGIADDIYIYMIYDIWYMIYDMYSWWLLHNEAILLNSWWRKIWALGIIGLLPVFLDIYIYQSVFYGLFMARRGKINQHFTAIKHGWLENPRTKWSFKLANYPGKWVISSKPCLTTRGYPPQLTQIFSYVGLLWAYVLACPVWKCFWWSRFKIVKARATFLKYLGTGVDI